MPAKQPAMWVMQCATRQKHFLYRGKSAGMLHAAGLQHIEMHPYDAATDPDSKRAHQRGRWLYPLQWRQICCSTPGPGLVPATAPLPGMETPPAAGCALVLARALGSQPDRGEELLSRGPKTIQRPTRTGQIVTACLKRSRMCCCNGVRAPVMTAVASHKHA